MPNSDSSLRVSCLRNLHAQRLFSTSGPLTPNMPANRLDEAINQLRRLLDKTPRPEYTRTTWLICDGKMYLGAGPTKASAKCAALSARAQEEPCWINPRLAEIESS